MKTDKTTKLKIEKILQMQQLCPLQYKSSYKQSVTLKLKNVPSIINIRLIAFQRQSSLSRNMAEEVSSSSCLLTLIST
jgi:hypothetical protein